MVCKRWTKEEIQEASEGRIPTGRSHRGTKRIRRMLGLPIKRKPQAPSKRTWTEEEIKAALENRVPPGRSPRSTDRIRKMLGAVPKRKRRKPWSKTRIRLLKRLHEKGIGARRMAAERLIPLSANAIQKMLARLGLSERRQVVKFTPIQRERLRAFLEENYTRHTPKELVLLWEERHPTLPPAGHRRVVAYLTAMGIKMPCREAVRVKATRRRDAIIAEKRQRRGASVKEIEEAIRQARVKDMRKRIENGSDIWCGFRLPREALEEVMNLQQQAG